MSSQSSDEAEFTSDNDEIPLSELRGKGLRTQDSSDVNESQESEEEEPEFEDNDEDDGDYEEDGQIEEDGEDEDANFEEDSDDSDIPLSALKKSPAKKKKTTPAKKKTKAKKAKPTATKKKKAAPKKKATATKKKKKASPTKTKKSSSGDSGLVTPSSELYGKSKKGKLIQSLLCRWWYAYSWPDPNCTKETPPNCDALDGFPGVYVHTSGDEVGKIVDLRDKSTCPNFANMMKKSSEELKELLLTAIQTQMEELIEAEGSGTQTEADLRKLEKWAKTVKGPSADKEAEKVLKAAGFA